MASGKDVWEAIAEREAYFGVATFDRYLAGELDESARNEFFESGREHVQLVFEELGETLGEIPRPTRALDYGCGVGRILIPLAERCERVVGVDISTRMLDESRRNMEAAGVTSFELQSADEFLETEAEFDLVHSYIVFQHIDPRIGYRIIGKILTDLKPGGVGMIHVTHTDTTPFFKRLRSRIYRDVPLVHRVTSVVRRNRSPFIPMYSYEMDKVFSIFDRNGCGERRLVGTDHSYRGTMIFFRKS